MIDKQIYQTTLESLKAKYQKETLTIKEVATELSTSPETLRAGMRAERNIPAYKVLGLGIERKKVVFPIHEVAKYLSKVERVY